MHELAKKNILLLAPKYFGYDEEIKKELEKFGSNVFLYDERPKNDFLTKAFLRLNIKSLIQKKIDTYYGNVISQTKDKKLDYLFLVNAETIDADKIQTIKKLHPDIKTYIYMWDSIKNKKKSMLLLPVADRFFTFDPFDIKIDSNIEFLPLFYIQDYEHLTPDENFDYDLSFVGTIHSDRYPIVEAIGKSGFKLFCYFYSPSKVLFKFQQLYYKNFKNIDIADISFESIEKQKLLRIIASSKAVIDIEHPDQKGLTMRTIEMVGAKKKLITTNSNIKYYDFYHAENIYIIDRKSPKIPIDFMETKFKNLPIDIYKKYSLRSWLSKIFAV